MNLTEKQIAFFEAEKELHKKKIADIDDRINSAIKQFENERNAEVEAIDAIQQVIDAAKPAAFVGYCQSVDDTETVIDKKVDEVVDESVEG